MAMNYLKTARSLFNGGWRASDRDDLIERYLYTEQQADVICCILSELQLKRAKAVLKAQSKIIEAALRSDEVESFLTDEEKADLWDTEANWIDRV